MAGLLVSVVREGSCLLESVPASYAGIIQSNPKKNSSNLIATAEHLAHCTSAPC